MFMLVPGGGVEPPRAEARRILSRAGRIWKPFKRNGFRNLPASTTRDWCSYVRFHRVRSGTFVAQLGELNSKGKTSNALNSLHTTSSSSILDPFTPAPPSPPAILQHIGDHRRLVLSHASNRCRTAQHVRSEDLHSPTVVFARADDRHPPVSRSAAEGVFHQCPNFSPGARVPCVVQFEGDGQFSPFYW